MEASEPPMLCMWTEKLLLLPLEATGAEHQLRSRLREYGLSTRGSVLTPPHNLF